METAKVDIRKLQLLNDRINQTLDALCQVRFTVHGLQHTTGVSPAMSPLNLGYAAQGIGYGTQGFGYGAPAIGYAAPQAIGYGAVPGFAHSSALSPSVASLAGIGAISPNVGYGIASSIQSPFASPFAASAISHWANPYVSPFVGLAHTSPEADPFWAVRFASTFPYAIFPTPPVVSMY